MIVNIYNDCILHSISIPVLNLLLKNFPFSLNDVSQGFWLFLDENIKLVDKI